MVRQSLQVDVEQLRYLERLGCLVVLLECRAALIGECRAAECPVDPFDVGQLARLVVFLLVGDDCVGCSPLAYLVARAETYAVYLADVLGNCLAVGLMDDSRHVGLRKCCQRGKNTPRY